MSDMTVSKAQALLDGATPGPWLANGEPWNLIVWSAADNRVCFMAHSNGLDDDRDVATAELVAAAPALARAYIAQAAELTRLRVKVEAADKLRAAGNALAEQAAHVHIGACIPSMNIHGSAKHLGPRVNEWFAALSAYEGGKE